MAAARVIPGVCAVLGSRSPPGTILTPLCCQSMTNTIAPLHRAASTDPTFRRLTALSALFAQPKPPCAPNHQPARPVAACGLIVANVGDALGGNGGTLASTDLCGGRSAMAVPTATHFPFHRSRDCHGIRFAGS